MEQVKKLGGEKFSLRGMFPEKKVAADGGAHKKKITPAKVGRFLFSIVRAVIVFGICYVILYPIFVKVSVSFMNEKDLYDATVKYVPKTFTLENYRKVIEGLEYGKSFLITTLMSGGVALLQLLMCMLTAYGFARFRFPGKGILFGCVIFTLIVPPQILMLPMYMNFRFFDIAGIVEAIRGQSINLLNSGAPVIIQALTCTGFKNGLYIYMLRQFFKGIPKELEEAAFVDGCGKLRTFVQIMMPVAVPMMVTVFLFGFVWQWTDSFYTGLYMPRMALLSNKLSSLAGTLSAKYQDMGGSMNFVTPGFASLMNNTGVLLVILPLVVLYLACQKHFVEGIARSGIVG